MSMFSEMVKAFQKGAGGIGKTFTGSENLQNITAGVAPTPNLNYDVMQFKPSLPGLNPALAGLPNLPTFSRPNLQNMLIEGQNINYGEKVTDWASNQLGFDADFGRNYLQDIQDWGGNQMGLNAGLFDHMSRTSLDILSRVGSGPDIGSDINTWYHRQILGEEEDGGSTTTTTTDTTDDTSITAAPDTSEEADALMSGAAKPGEMSERDRLARIRRMLAGRYGRAETQLTKGGFGEGTGRSLTGYA
jgi:hypothetical protein